MLGVFHPPMRWLTSFATPTRRKFRAPPRRRSWTTSAATRQLCTRRSTPVANPSDNVTNLFEIPVIFYALAAPVRHESSRYRVRDPIRSQSLLTFAAVLAAASTNVFNSGLGLPSYPVARARIGFEISFRHHSTRYEITVENPHGVTRGVSLVELDGTAAGAGISLADDGAMHRVRVVLGEREASSGGARHPDRRGRGCVSVRAPNAGTWDVRPFEGAARHPGPRNRFASRGVVRETPGRGSRRS